MPGITLKDIADREEIFIGGTLVEYDGYEGQDLLPIGEIARGRITGLGIGEVEGYGRIFYVRTNTNCEVGINPVYEDRHDIRERGKAIKISSPFGMHWMLAPKEVTIPIHTKEGEESNN